MCKGSENIYRHTKGYTYVDRHIHTIFKEHGVLADLSPSCLHTFLPAFYIRLYFSTLSILVSTHQDVYLSELLSVHLFFLLSFPLSSHPLVCLLIHLSSHLLSSFVYLSMGSPIHSPFYFYLEVYPSISTRSTILQK